MEFTTIESVIKTIAESSFPSFTYVFDNWTDADTKMDVLPYPAIVAVMPVSGEVRMHNGRFYDAEYMGLAFLDKAPRNAEGEDNATVYNRMKAEAVRFVAALNATRKFAPIENVQYDIICERMGTIASGVMLQLTIEQQIGACV